MQLKLGALPGHSSRWRRNKLEMRFLHNIWLLSRFLSFNPLDGSTSYQIDGIEHFSYPQADVYPPTALESFSTNKHSVQDEENEISPVPTWLYPRVDWEAKSRWGHCSLKIFALLARLAAAGMWMLEITPEMPDWKVRCLFYHACPGLLGIESSAILPYFLSPIPFRTISYVHDILGVALGTIAAIVIQSNCSEQQTISTLMILTVVPLIFDLLLHLTTLPKHVVHV
ncbi:Hypothetical protein NTJ_14789 [Nesidiocoris tenuis]|uniref:Uncharacterized protein n=1 Tax=Nesidiocoris tenuis TaxID=355587 RepID=A0ABN7BE91_9HEMI|nr:Hypothetical protein NTJ_14789 [Nesidiocoris tenuis]